MVDQQLVDQQLVDQFFGRPKLWFFFYSLNFIAIFYQNETEKKIIDEKIAALNKELAPEKVAAEVMPFEKFWIGEDYHQNYERLHPEQGYIVGVSIPRLKRFQKKFPHLIKEDAKQH